MSGAIDLDAIEARAEAAAHAAREYRYCRDCNMSDPPEETHHGYACHVGCRRPNSLTGGAGAVATTHGIVGHYTTLALIADVAALLIDARASASECARLQTGVDRDRAHNADLAAKHIALCGHESACVTVQCPGIKSEGCNCVAADIERGCMGDVAHALRRARAEAATLRASDSAAVEAMRELRDGLGLAPDATYAETVDALRELIGQRELIDRGHRDEADALRRIVEAARRERAVRAAWLATLPTCATAPAEVLAAEAATGAWLAAWPGSGEP